MMPSNVSSVVDAYRGREPELMQRYQNSQELIYLLALQKLKSEKEAAMRDIQMKMNPQGEPPTVAQQREGEVRDLSMKELAAQSAATMQNRQAQIQEAQRNLLQRGIAAAPGAQNAGQMLAGGGIVAFNGEEDGSFVGPPNVNQAGMSIAERADDYRRRRGSIYRDPRSAEEIQADANYAAQAAAARAAVAENAARERSGRRSSIARGDTARDPATLGGIAGGIADIISPITSVIGAPFQQFQGDAAQDALAAYRLAQQAGQGGSAPPPVVAPPNVPPPPPGGGAAPNTGGAAGPAAAAPAARTEDQARALDAERGLAAVGAAPEGPHAEIMKLLRTDPYAAFAKYQALYPKMSAEDRAARLKAIEDLKRAKEAEFDPKQQALAGLARFLLGAAGRTRGQEFAGAGAAGLNYLTQQQAAERERAKEIRAEEEKLRGAGEAEQRAAFEAGLAGLKEAGLDRRGGISGAASTYGADTSAAASRYSSELHLEGVRLATEAKKVENELARKTLDLRSAETAYSTLSARRADLQQRAERRLDAVMPMNIKLLQMKQQRTPDEELKLRQYELDRDTEIRQALSETDKALARLETKLGVPSTAPSASKVDTSGFKIVSSRPGPR